MAATTTKKPSGMGVVMGITLALIGLKACNGGYSETPKTEADYKAEYCSTSKDAQSAFYEIATRNVKARLKAPSTAVFPYYDERGVSYEKGSTDCTYIVRGYVDAQNSFGALIRSTWMVTVWYDHHDSKSGDDYFEHGFPVIDE